MKIAVQLVALTLLAGCCPKPTIIKEPFEVKVPVPVPCKVTLPEKPVWALDTVAPGANVFTKGLAALQEIEQRRQYERELKAAMKECL